MLIIGIGFIIQNYILFMYKSHFFIHIQQID